MGSRTIGIIGVGEIASAIVEGACAGDDHPDFFLSPRSAERSARLANDFDRVEVCERNQDVIDRSELIILAVLPQQTEAVLAELDIPADRTVVSAIAGVSTQVLSPLLPQNPSIVRIIPLPPVRERRGEDEDAPVHREPASGGFDTDAGDQRGVHQPGFVDLFDDPANGAFRGVATGVGHRHSFRIGGPGSYRFSPGPAETPVVRPSLT